MSPDAGDEGAVRRALQKVVLQSLQPVFLSLTGLFLLFSYTDGQSIPGPAGHTIAMTDIALAFVLQALFWPLWRGAVTPRMAHAWALVAGLAILADVGISLALTGDPVQSMGLVLIQFGASLFFLSTPAMAALLIATDLVWIGVALQQGQGAGSVWVEWGTIMAASTVVSAVAQTLRVRTLRRLEALRLQDARTKTRLQQALDEAEEATAQAQRSRERFRLVAESTFEGICIHDGTKIVDANPVFGALLGVEPSRLIGRPLAQLVDAPTWAAVGPRMATPTDEPLELALLHQDGSGVRVEVRGRPSPLGHGRAHVLAFRDLRTRDQAREAMQQVKFLTEVNEFKTQFINMASHELRTPLTPIMLQMAVLRQPETERPVQARAVEILHRNLMRLNKLMDDVLDSARIQAERLQVSLRPVDLEGLVRDAAETFEEPARRNGLKLAVASEGALWVNADADRLHQVMMNLMSNAVKFTPQGGCVEVDAKVRGGCVEVRVRDSGPGIAGEDIEKLFRPFSQLQDTTVSVTQGSGLGLHISRGIVEGHGGRIWCESDGPGKGSTFCFALPCDDRPAA